MPVAWASPTYTITDLGTFGGTYSFAFGINASGQVAGYAYTTGNATGHAYLYSGGAMTDLGTLGGNFSAAFGINDSGQVVGNASTADFGQHAFLYTSSSMLDLNDLIAPGSGWTLTNALGINASGQIIGHGDIGGETHAFLLNPMGAAAAPEPGSLAFLGMTALPLIGLLRRRKA